MTTATEHEIDVDRRALAADPAALRLARKVAEKAAREWPHLADDFESAALLALVEAARTFDPALGFRFVTHAEGRVRGAMVDVMRREAPAGYRRRRLRVDREAAPGTVSFSAAADASGTPIPPGELAASDDLPVGWEAEYHDELEGLARTLPGRLGAALRLFFGRADCATHARTGAALGVSESRVSQMIGQSAEFLRPAPDRASTEETSMSTAATNTNGVPAPADPPAFTCFECGHDLDPDGKCRQPGCSRSWDKDLRASKPASAPAPAPAPTPPAKAKSPASDLGSCPDCGTPYTKRRRCWNTKCPRVGMSAPSTGTPGGRPKSRFRGVHANDCKDRPWRSVGGDGAGGTRLLGPFATEEEAARAVDAARVACGEPPVNFPDETGAAPIAPAPVSVAVRPPAPTRVPRPTPAPAAVPPTSPALRRLDAARRVAEALDGLDEADVRGVLALVNLVVAGDGGPGA